jgi:isoquinoline 1-oxidoreductase beta subunit
MYDQITLDKGRVQQSNFHDDPMIRVAEAPMVETHIVDSGEAPGGLGEPAVPTVVPSITNAIFALTAKRIRRLPIRPEDLRRA